MLLKNELEEAAYNVYMYVRLSSQYSQVFINIEDLLGMHSLHLWKSEIYVGNRICVLEKL